MYFLFYLLLSCTLIFLPSISFAAYPGVCSFVWSKVLSTGSQPSNFTEKVFTPNLTAGTISATWGIYHAMKIAKSVQVQILYKETEGGGWLVKASQTGQVLDESSLPGLLADNPPSTGCPSEPVCDTDDDDSDSVCNQCDTRPDAPDPDDCVISAGYDINTNKIQWVVVDRGCTGTYDTQEFHLREGYVPGTARGMGYVGDSRDNLGKNSCREDATTTEECCAYPPNTMGASYLNGLTKTDINLQPTIKDMVDQLTELPELNNDPPDSCADHNAQCQKACADKLGVALSYCREGASDCKCNNDFQYQTKPTDAQTPTLDNPTNTDTNNNNIPDYADEDIQQGGDSDNDGITDKADVDNTGGSDTNSDGIDDKATTEAHATANATSGLSQKDSANLADIEQNTGNIIGALKATGSSLDRIVGNQESEKQAADAHRTKINSVLDSFNEENEAEFSGAHDGTFQGIGDDILPEDESENFDIDQFIEDFNYGAEMKDAIMGSEVSLTAADPCISGVVRGANFEFCFNKFQSIFLLMGSILKALSGFKAFDIVVTGGRGFGG